MNVTYENLNDMVELEWKALCGNPNVYTYNWFWSNDSSMTQIGQNSIFSYNFCCRFLIGIMF